MRRVIEGLGMVMFAAGCVGVLVALLGPVAPGSMRVDTMVTLAKFPGGRDAFGAWAIAALVTGEAVMVASGAGRIDKPTRSSKEPIPFDNPEDRRWEGQRRVSRYDSWS